METSGFKKERFKLFASVIGPMIKEARESSGMSISAFANRINCANKTAEKLEAGDVTVYSGLYFSAWSQFLELIPNENVEQALLDCIKKEVASPQRRGMF